MIYGKISLYKRITQFISIFELSGTLQDGVLGDKETAVRIRGNSHYRI